MGAATLPSASTRIGSRRYHWKSSDGHAGRLVQQFEIGAVRDGAGEMKMRGDADTAAAVMRRDSLVVHLRQPGDLAQAAHRLGDECLRLENVVDIVLDHRAELV